MSLAMATGLNILANAVRPISRVSPVLVAIAVGSILFVGWMQRDEEYLTPETGLGYWLGIYGGSAMLMLLIYSLRKRYQVLRVIGSVPFWFRFHMMLGIAGPVLIIFHSNFSLGSLNSNVALFTMLMVAASGIVGRYLYGKIHLGLYGRKAEIKEILADADSLKEQLGDEFLAMQHIVDGLNEFSQRLEKRTPRGLVSSFLSGGALAVSTRLSRGKIVAEARRLVRKEARSRGWSWRERRRRLAKVTEIVNSYFGAVLKAAEFTFYERLFALWHVLHLPLFFLMVMAAVIHVWAVHHY